MDKTSKKAKKNPKKPKKQPPQKKTRTKMTGTLSENVVTKKMTVYIREILSKISVILKVRLGDTKMARKRHKNKV